MKTTNICETKPSETHTSQVQVTFYTIQPGNRSGLPYSSRGPHGATIPQYCWVCCPNYCHKTMKFVAIPTNTATVTTSTKLAARKHYTTLVVVVSGMQLTIA